eukprot:XP_001699227.1 predicted protein [Chlamydomonas reinhardtii]
MTSVDASMIAAIAASGKVSSTRGKAAAKASRSGGGGGECWRRREGEGAAGPAQDDTLPEHVVAALEAAAEEAMAMVTGVTKVGGPSKQTRGACRASSRRPSTSAHDRQQRAPQPAGSSRSREGEPGGEDEDKAGSDDEEEPAEEPVEEPPCASGGHTTGGAAGAAASTRAGAAAGPSQQHAAATAVAQHGALSEHEAEEAEEAAASAMGAAKVAPPPPPQPADAGRGRGKPVRPATNNKRKQRNPQAVRGDPRTLLLPAFHNLYTTNVLAVSAVLLTSAWHKGLASGVSDPVNAAFFGGGSNMPSIVRLHLSEALAHLASMPPHVHALGPALAVTLAYNTCHGPGVTPTALLDLVGHLATHIPLEALVVAGLVTHGAWIHAAGTTIGLLHSAPAMCHIRDSLPPSVAKQLLHTHAPDVLPAALHLLAPADHASPLATLICTMAAPHAPSSNHDSVLHRLTRATDTPAPWLLAASWVHHAAWCRLCEDVKVSCQLISLNQAVSHTASLPAPTE